MQRTQGGEPIDERVDFFFTARAWTGEPRIVEPDKAGELRWCLLSDLPDPMVPHEAYALSQLGTAAPIPEPRIRHLTLEVTMNDEELGPQPDPVIEEKEPNPGGADAMPRRRRGRGARPRPRPGGQPGRPGRGPGRDHRARRGEVPGARRARPTTPRPGPRTIPRPARRPRTVGRAARAGPTGRYEDAAIDVAARARTDLDAVSELADMVQSRRSTAARLAAEVALGPASLAGTGCAASCTTSRTAPARCSSTATSPGSFAPHGLPSVSARCATTTGAG